MWLDALRHLRVDFSTQWALGSSGAPLLDHAGNVIAHVSTISSLGRGRGNPPLLTIRTGIPAQSVERLVEAMRDPAEINRLTTLDTPNDWPTRRLRAALRPVIPAAMRFVVLGSGSTGNAALVEAGSTKVLVDAGFSARQLQLRLHAAGVAPESLAAVVLTHEHGDHVRGLDVLLRGIDVPVMATSRTAEVLRDAVRRPLRWRCFEAGQSFEIGELRVDAFEVMHDAVDPVGFVFRNRDVSLGFLSDLGHATDALRSRLEGVHGLFVEANYQAGLLEADTRRPWPTKQRISSRHGHFSNDQAAELVAGIAHPGLRQVVLGHLSCDCNRPELACAAVAARLAAGGWAGVRITCATQDGPGGWHALG